MAWILLLLAFACFLVPYFTTSFALGALCLALALLLMLAAMAMLLARRLQNTSRRDVEILSASELHALRERALSEQPSAGESAGPSDPARDPPSALSG